MVNDPVPSRVDTAVKDTLLGLVDHALEADWSLLGTCRVLLISPRRIQRWWLKRDAQQLADARPGGSVNQLMPSEVEAILALFDTFAREGPLSSPAGAPRLLHRHVLGVALHRQAGAV